MKSVARFAVVAATAAVLTGCSSDPTGVSYSSIVNNPSPELRGLTERPVDNYTAYKLTHATNLRMLSDDIMRVFYLDKPSYLTPAPMVQLSGQPR